MIKASGQNIEEEQLYRLIDSVYVTTSLAEWHTVNADQTDGSSCSTLFALLTLLLLNTIYPVLANSVDPDQLASEEANWSGSALFAIKYVNLYQQSGSSNLIGWKLKVGVAS